MSSFSNFCRQNDCLMAFDAERGGRILSPILPNQKRKLEPINMVATSGRFTTIDTDYFPSVLTPLDMRGYHGDFTLFCRADLGDTADPAVGSTRYHNLIQQGTVTQGGLQRGFLSFIQVSSSGRAFAVHITNGTQATSASCPVPILVGVHDYCVVIKHQARMVDFYVDGELLATVSFSGTAEIFINPTATNTQVAVGRYDTWKNPTDRKYLPEYYFGAVFNRALNAGEIKYLNQLSKVKI